MCVVEIYLYQRQQLSGLFRFGRDKNLEINYINNQKYDPLFNVKLSDPHILPYLILS